MSLARADIRTLFCLVREFLEYFSLDFTNTVFEKESFMGILYDYKGKERLIKDLEIGMENSETPLLLEILNIARNNYKSKTLNEINNVTYEVEKDNKTVDELDSFNKSVSIQGDKSLNESNELSISSVEKEQKADDDPRLLESEKIKFETDDTYEGTSSIAEDSIVSNNNNKDQQPMIDLDKTGKLLSSPAKNVASNIVRSLIDQTLDESPPNKSPRLETSDKKKEKTKPMSGLSSLSDLPPLQVSKARSPDTVLLPSLYSKEFREKSNLKEIDKLLDLNFDSIDNYEEDFILDYERNKNISAVLKNDTNKHFASMKLFENKLMKINDNLLTPTNSPKDIVDNINCNLSDKNDTSISEELDFNSNSDDVLKSNDT